MNEDELRAFLESATVGDDDQDGDAAGDAVDDSGDAVNDSGDAVNGSDAREATPVTSDRPSAPMGGNDPSRKPSFEELLGMGNDNAPTTPAAPPAFSTPPVAGVGAPEDDAGVVPLILPAPPSRQAPRQAARPAPPADPVPPAAPPVPAPRSAVQVPPPAEPATAPIAPVVSTPQPSPEPEPVPATAPLNLGIDNLFDNASAPGAPDTEPDEYERIAVTGGEKRRFVPWIVAGSAALVALIVAVVVVFAVRGGEQEPEPTAAPPTSETPTETSPSQEPDPAPEEPDEPDAPPAVDVGTTSVMPVAGWGVQVDVSNRLGIMNYVLQGEDLLFSGGLLAQLPAGCAVEPWGMSRLADGGFEALVPAERCEAAPELYDEIWGLMAAMAASARPL